MARTAALGVPAEFWWIGGFALAWWAFSGRAGGSAAGRYLPVLVVPGGPPIPPPPIGAPPAGVPGVCGPDNPELCAVPGAPNPADPGLTYTPIVNDYCTNNISDPVCVGLEQGGGGMSLPFTIPGAGGSGVQGPVQLVP